MKMRKWGLLAVVTLGIAACNSPQAPQDSADNAPKHDVAAEPTLQQIARRKEMFDSYATGMDDKGNEASVRLSYAKMLMSSHADTPEGARAALLIPELEQLVKAESVGRQWSYWSDEDPMTSKVTRGAKVQSKNSFEFDFPYKGTQYATLTLRKHPSYGSDVMFSIEKGQILCSSYQCPIRIRFDDAPPVTYDGTGPADNSSETVFIPGFASLEKKIAAANRVRIEVNVHDQGVLMAEFDVSGYKPEKIRPSK